ncbi:MAG: hypothetical protein IKM43_01600 [Clostridia bacterium]|nr:hypothetical protein [Clostridia bacterium]
MDLEQEQEISTNIETEIKPETKEQTFAGLDDLPRLEDLLKSEKEIKSSQELAGLKQVEAKVKAEDKPFARAADEKKAFVKKRVKVLTGVYTAVVTLLLAFVGVNLFTLVSLNKQIDTNTKTIQAESVAVEIYEEDATTPADPTNPDIIISLNTPRDYADDKKELTWLDKITILFRNLFG